MGALSRLHKALGVEDTARGDTLDELLTEVALVGYLSLHQSTGSFRKGGWWCVIHLFTDNPHVEAEVKSDSYTKTPHECIRNALGKVNR